MTNPSHSISHILFLSRAPAKYGIIRPVALLLLSAGSPSATAQTTTSSSSQDLADSNFNPAMGIVIAVLICAFFFTCFLSLYIRYCAGDDAELENFRDAAVRRLQSKRGIDPDVIDSFPIFQYSEIKDIKIGKGGALECAVCLAEFENDDILRLLPKCDHVFHPDCIDAWLASHVTCPVCRANLTPCQDETAEETESSHSNNSAGLGEARNQIQISIDTDEVRNREVQVSEIPKRNRRGGKFSRSHSTGHSLIQPGEGFERYTLRLPEEVRGQMMSRTLKRTISSVVFAVEESSRRGDGSSRWRHVGWSDRWFFSMTPPFLSRSRVITSPKSGVEGDITAIGGSKLFSTKVETDGVEQTWTRPPVKCNTLY